MPKTVTLRLDDNLYRRLKGTATADRRPLANWIETTILRHLEECQFVSDLEMAEIRRNRDLVVRLHQGSQDARARRGRLVG